MAGVALLPQGQAGTCAHEASVEGDHPWRHRATRRFVLFLSHSVVLFLRPFFIYIVYRLYTCSGFFFNRTGPHNSHLSISHKVLLVEWCSVPRRVSSECSPGGFCLSVGRRVCSIIATLSPPPPIHRRRKNRGTTSQQPFMRTRNPAEGNLTTTSRHTRTLTSQHAPRHRLVSVSVASFSLCYAQRPSRDALCLVVSSLALFLLLFAAGLDIRVSHGDHRLLRPSPRVRGYWRPGDPWRLPPASTPKGFTVCLPTLSSLVWRQIQAADRMCLHRRRRFFGRGALVGRGAFHKISPDL